MRNDGVQLLVSLVVARVQVLSAPSSPFPLVLSGCVLFSLVYVLAPFSVEGVASTSPKSPIAKFRRVFGATSVR